jgi:hypothetical protein
MRRALDKGNSIGFLKELLHIALDANELEDFKMSPRAISDIVATIDKLREEGSIEEATDDGVDAWADDDETAVH